MTKDPLDILAYQYDIVCNGIELSSGAVRNHDIKKKEKINGKVFYVEDFGDKYAVIVSYSTDESRTDAPILYTQTYYINKENEIFEGLTK